MKPSRGYNLFRPLLVVWLAGMIVVASCGGSASQGSEVAWQVHSNSAQSDPLSDQAEPAGYKSYLVKQAVRLVAAALRKGGDVLEYLLKWLDDDAARALGQHGDRVADFLDDVARIPDLTVELVKEKLFYFLMSSCGLPGGTALPIADAVATTINWLLL